MIKPSTHYHADEARFFFAPPVFALLKSILTDSSICTRSRCCAKALAWLAELSSSSLTTPSSSSLSLDPASPSSTAPPSRHPHKHVSSPSSHFPVVVETHSLW